MMPQNLRVRKTPRAPAAVAARRAKRRIVRVGSLRLGSFWHAHGWRVSVKWRRTGELARTAGPRPVGGRWRQDVQFSRLSGSSPGRSPTNPNLGTGSKSFLWL